MSQWADTKRRLSEESASEPGQWHTSRAEYQREIMDAIADPSVHTVVVEKASQVGWTEILLNTIGFYVDQDPAPLLIIQPSLEAAETWSKERLAPMIRDCPALRARVADPASRDSGNTMRQKLFQGGFLAIVGANSPTGLAMRPIRIVLCDEVDRYEASAGTEGDPLKLAAKRQLTFWNRKTLLGSTPVRKGTSVIDREFKRSDQRRFMVPCPDCGHGQYLKWAQVRWDKAGEDEVEPEGDLYWPHKPDTAHYVCEDCGAIWSDVRRWEAIGQGTWKATAPFNGVAGFHVPGFLSPWLPLSEIVNEFLTAKAVPELLQVWVNTVLGEPWEEPGETVEAASISTRGEAYSGDALPDGVQLLVAGGDVQGDRVEVQVMGYGVKEECWAIEYHVLLGDPAQQTVWDAVDDLLKKTYTRRDGRVLHIRGCCIDTGGHHANQVFAFCRARRARNVLPIKGVPGPRAIWPKRGTRSKKNRDVLYLVGVDTAKDAIYGRLRGIVEPGPGYIHFPVGEDFDQEYFRQLTIERAMTKYRLGRPYRVWECPHGARNEALDTAVYALAARMSIPIRLVDPKPAAAQPAQPRPVMRAAEEMNMPVPPPRAPAQQPAQQRSQWQGRRTIRSSYMD